MPISAQLLLTLAILQVAHAANGGLDGQTTAVGTTAATAATKAINTVAAINTDAPASGIKINTDGITGGASTAAASAAAASGTAVKDSGKAETTEFTAGTTPPSTKATTDSNGVTYNQWGFIGSQSVWEATTLSAINKDGSLSSGASSSGSSIHSISKVQNNTAPRHNNPFAKDLSWEHGFVLGGVLAIGLALNVL